LQFPENWALAHPRSALVRRRRKAYACGQKVISRTIRNLGEDVVRLSPVLASALVFLFAGELGARAQISDNVVRIGVMNDQSGLYADLGGPGSVTAARMAVEDAGGSVLGKPIEVVFADHQNKADSASPLRGAGLRAKASTWRSGSTIPRSPSRSSSSRGNTIESPSPARSAAPPSPARTAMPMRHPGSMTATR
jgi:hypothetical protein